MFNVFRTASLLSAVSSYAIAASYDYSISAQVGSAIVASKLNQSSANGSNAVLTFKKPLKNSVIYNISVSTRAYDTISLALELSHAPKHKFSSSIGPIKGLRVLSFTNVSTTSLFLNSLYHVEALKYRFTPYVGLGIGYSANRMGHIHQRTPAVAGGSVIAEHNEIRKRSRKFAWQAILGVLLPVNERINIDFSYRYRDLGKVSTGSKYDPEYGYRPTLEGRLKTSNIMIGVAYKF